MHSPTLFGSLNFIIFCCTLLTAVAAIPHGHDKPPGNDSIPVFIVQNQKASAKGALKIANQLFGPDNYNSTFIDGRYLVFSSDGTKRVEFDIASGGIWAADESELWNTEPEQWPDLPSDDEAIKLANDLVAKHNLLPAEAGPVKISVGRISGTFLARDSKKYKREEYQLDVTVNYDITLSIPYGPDPEYKYPLVGGGGKFQFTFGNCGKLIAYQALWRDICEKKLYDVVSQAEADEEFLDSTGYLNDTISFNSTKAYFSAPFGEFQEAMYPVYVYTASAQVGNETVPLRPTLQHASRYGKKDYPKSSRRSLHQPNALRRRANQDDDKLEAATEWLGLPFGLMDAEQNAAGFRNAILDSDSDWSINYERGNEDVHVSDFISEDDIWADSVDFLFYTGHANSDGWLATEESTGVETIVAYTSMGTTPDNPGDLLGEQDLEWLVIAACGPHQDQSFDPSVGNVFDRWRGIFDGLHIMFAYGTESYDTTEEGSRLIMYSQERYRLIDSWFRTAKEVQSSGVIVTAMWTAGPGGNARNDHLPGYGWVSKDNLAKSQERWFMWTKC